VFYRHSSVLRVQIYNPFLNPQGFLKNKSK